MLLLEPLVLMRIGELLLTYGKLSNAIVAVSYSSLQVNERALQDLQGKVKGQVRDDGEPVCLRMFIHSVFTVIKGKVYLTYLL